MRFNAANGRYARLPMLVVLGVLGILVVITFILYMNKLSQVPKGDSRDANESRAIASGQINEELSPPEDIKVRVENGATIRWTADNDATVIGYNVYRYKAGDDPGSKINAAIVSDIVYHDDDGTMFNSYAVAPVDSEGRQGVVSVPVAAVAEPVSLGGLTPTQQPREVKDTTFEGPSQGTNLPAGVVDCTAEGMSYHGVWYLEHYAEVAGGTLMVTPYAGDNLVYTFSGDSVTVISTRHWNYGIMGVYIDGKLRQEIDLYSPQVMVSQRVFSISGLGPGVHTIKLACTGRKSQDASFTFIDLEALEIK